MKTPKFKIYDILVFITAVFTVIFLFCPLVCADHYYPLSVKVATRYGLNFGYDYSISSSMDIRSASVYPYYGKVLTNTFGSGVLRGTLEGVVDGAFSFVFKNQRTYSAGVNILARYNFLPHYRSMRPYVQGGLGIAITNLSLHNFGSNFNFVSNFSCGLQYFYNTKDAVNIEWRFFHMSNGGIDKDNVGLNMSNFFIGYSRLF